MKKLLIATRNPGKFKEIKSLLSDLPLEILSLDDLKIEEDPIEDGRTFEENAIKKAKFYSKKSGLPTLADDGGLEIDSLGGEPGVTSSRWIGGKKSSDKKLISYTLEKLKGVSDEGRGAQLRAILALVLPDGKVFVSEGRIRGIIAKKVSKYYFPGYPFRSLLFIPSVGKFYNQKELTKEENEKINHRRKAVRRLKKIIKEKLLN